LYARGAADDKAAILAMMAALDAIRASGLKTGSNIKFAFEGEEEAGSPNFEKILAGNKALFAGNVWLSCDGPLHQSRRQLLTFGDRGISSVDSNYRLGFIAGLPGDVRKDVGKEAFYPRIPSEF